MSKRINLKVHLPKWITKLFPLAVWTIPTGEKVVYLTFDDGPIPEVTPQVLDILKEKNIEATFFCVGENVWRYPDLFEHIKDEGHSVGNHTYNHLQGIKCSRQYYIDNIEKANNLIGSNMFRPPHGLMKQSQYYSILNKYKIVMWDVISCDYDPDLSPETCYRNVIDYVSDGSIITFHDSLKAEHNVLNALPRVIDYLLEEGYTFRKIEFPGLKPLKSATVQEKFQEIRNNINKLIKRA
ncbi:MAG: polysaccharide deacetylase family protein [Prolixibacteraceae bacterium]|nr:polysaccharide deacetylase family protein [Prolixibacteraceae bacterium]